MNTSDLGNKEIFAKNLSYYMNLNHISRIELSEKLNIPYTTITDWLKARKYPRIDKIEMLSNYFGITKADLIESNNKKQFDEFDILFSKYKEMLTEDDKDIIKMIIEKRKREIDSQNE